MMVPAAARYHQRVVHVSPFGAVRSIAAGVLFALGVAFAPASAAAASATYDVGAHAVVQIGARTGNITVRTWDRASVLAEWDGKPFAPSHEVRSFGPRSMPIPPRTVPEYRSPSGALIMATLPPEDFPMPALSAGLHDFVRIVESKPPGDAPPGDAHLTVTIPATTELLVIKINGGTLQLTNFHGTSVLFSGSAHVTYDAVGGDAFVQALNGYFYAVDSDFNRLRARTNRADLVFEHCNAKQIDASTLTGNIDYDDGTFSPGLARFGSDRGDIALGVDGDAQLDAHTEGGRVRSMLNVPFMPIPGGGVTDISQIAGRGGPIVNASTLGGNVYFYTGSIAELRPGGAGWRGVRTTLISKRGTAGVRFRRRLRRNATAKTSAASRRPT
jgi:hypothetical protein